jgi:hypothetical protein
MKKYLIIVVFLFILLFDPFNMAHAEFSLSVRPYDGGYDLDFGKIGLIATGTNKELIVNMNSDSGKQYRLIQNVYEPLTNSNGISLNQRNNLFCYAVRGSNKYGTISVEQENPVSMARTIIYTSNSQGLFDSFNLVYNFRGPFDVPSGSYRGRIAFTLEAVDNSQPPVTVFVNLFAEIEVAAGIEIRTVNNSKIITLNSKNAETKSAQLSFDITGPLGSQYKIVQSVAEPLRSPDGQELPLETVSYQVQQIRNGSGPNKPVPLSLNAETLYTSDSNGRQDNFLEIFTLSDSSSKAGRYKTNLTYLLEGGPGIKTQRLDNYILEVEIEKEFDIEIKTESGTGAISFQNLNPKQPSRTYEVDIYVKSNIGKNYMVTQKVLSDLTNKEGKSIPSKYFTVITQNLQETKGNLKLVEKTEVKTGDTVLFISDSKGSADSFRLIYELSVPADIKAGDYSASLVYSLSEL